jgi:hypothetical protein
MPNWCVNRVIVTGPKRLRDEFVQRARGAYPRYKDEEAKELPPAKDPIEELQRNIAKLDEEPNPEQTFCFHQFVPIPAAILAGGYSEKGYNWQCKHWGTKWGAHDTHVKHNARRTRMDFETAWSPPEPVLAAIANQFPGLRFVLQYWERGVGYQGISIYEKGKQNKRASKCWDGYNGNKGG